MERSRGPSFVSRERLRHEWSLYQRARWVPNYGGFTHLIDIGIILLDPDVFEGLLQEKLDSPVTIELRYMDPPNNPHLVLVPDDRLNPHD